MTSKGKRPLTDIPLRVGNCRSHGVQLVNERGGEKMLEVVRLPRRANNVFGGFGGRQARRERLAMPEESVEGARGAP